MTSPVLSPLTLVLILSPLAELVIIELKDQILCFHRLSDSDVIFKPIVIVVVLSDRF